MLTITLRPPSVVPPPQSVMGGSGSPWTAVRSQHLLRVGGPVWCAVVGEAFDCLVHHEDQGRRDDICCPCVTRCSVLREVGGAQITWKPTVHTRHSRAAPKSSGRKNPGGVPPPPPPDRQGRTPWAEVAFWIPPPRQGDARGSADARSSVDACLSWQKVQRREASRRRHRLTEPTTKALCQTPPLK